MWKPATCLAAVLGVAIVGAVSFPANGDAQDPDIRHEIRQSGEARFYRVRGSSRRPLWTVSCRMPLRGCAARAPGVILSLHAEGTLRLLGFAPSGARISVLQDGAARLMPGLFQQPLDAETLAVLSRPDSVLIVENKDEVLSRTPVDGIDITAAYLLWLNGAAQAGVRDARIWIAPDGTPDPSAPTSVMSARAPQDPSLWPQHVPRTKPQIEFAIRAQEGGSFFDPSGR